MNRIVIDKDIKTNLSKTTFVDGLKSIVDGVTGTPANEKNRKILESKIEILIHRHKQAEIIKGDVYFTMNGITELELNFFDGNNKKIEYVENIFY